MAKVKKSKRFRQRREQQRKQREYAALQRKLEQGPLGAGQILIEPKGQVKMSEVLEAFVEPYLDAAETDDALQKLFTLAVAAWNAALLPEPKQQAMVDDLIGSQSGLSRRDKKDLRSMIDALIARKKAHFADYRRAIVQFNLAETRGGDLHLTVASIPGDLDPIPDSETE